MTAPPEEAALATFLALRGGLVRLAHRLTGSLAEAEDTVQDAFLRWQAQAPGSIENPEAFLRTIVGRLALDRLRSARHRREVYVGPWLPEPVVEALEAPQQEGLIERETVSTAFMLALERLTPRERAAFVLHDLFAMPFSEIARIIERPEASCRKLAERARLHVRLPERRVVMSADVKSGWAKAFFMAARNGDVEALTRMLAADATLVTDGGGVRSSALRRIEGAARIARFFAGLARKYGRRTGPVAMATIDGQPGYVTLEQDGLPQTTALAVEGDRIVAIYILRNPAKLAPLPWRALVDTGDTPIRAGEERVNAGDVPRRPRRSP